MRGLNMTAGAFELDNLRLNIALMIKYQFDIPTQPNFMATNVPYQSKYSDPTNIYHPVVKIPNKSWL